MCDYLKRMSPQDTPTDDIRWWSGLAHSVVEYTGPKPFGIDGIVCLWLHERSATQLLDMCDELDAKFSDLKSENAKLRELVEEDSEQLDRWQKKAEYYSQLSQLAEAENARLRELVRALDWCTENADVRDKCDRCPLEQSDACEPECEVMMRELGVEVDG